MSFQIPQNAPSFNSTQRAQEDAYWRHKNTNGHPKGGGLSSKLNDLMGAQQDLPMYKDKPNFPASRRKGSTGQKVGAVLAMVAMFLWFTGMLPVPGLGTSMTETRTGSSSWKPKTDANLGKFRREAVKDVFVTSWDGYEKYAWGMDEYHPISKKGRNMVQGGMGWIIVDSLDTAIMMNLTSQVARAREWISTSLSYNANHDVSTFETTIRMLGGLLSAHHLSTTYPNLAPQRDDDFNQPGEDLYIEKAMDLADRLLGAYDTASGIPTASVNLNTSQGLGSRGDFGASSTAEAATLQLEMKYLSKITGEPIYWLRSENIMKVIDDQHAEDGLVPIFINPNTGSFSGSNIRLGSRGDSYYEYLIKQFLQTSGGEPVYLDLWNEALAGIKKNLITYTKNSSLTVLAERPSGLQHALTPKMDHLVCFMPGTIALSVTNGSTVAEAKRRLGDQWSSTHDENMRLAEELMRTCWGMYAVTPTGLAPEISYFHVDDPPRPYDPHHSTAANTGPSSSKSTKSTFSSVSATVGAAALDLSTDPSAPWRDDYDIHPQDVHNLQRPETIESLFYMYHITQNPLYREWAWKMFVSFRQHTKLVDDLTGQVYGYASLDTVMENPVQDRRRRDNMESFWLAETLKYFWLVFQDTDDLKGLGAGLEETVANTEAHFLPRFGIQGSKVWKTGWERSRSRSQRERERERERETGDVGNMVLEKGEKAQEAVGLEAREQEKGKTATVTAATTTEVRARSGGESVPEDQRQESTEIKS